MYDREYDGRTLEFETSGGLLNASLVMRDRQTDSWWSIIRGDAIGGMMQGEKLKELAAGDKMTWGEWRRRHPDTLVLSVDGREHERRDPYAGYFTSDKTFRGMEIHDHRLKPKQPIFSFQHDSVPYAAAHHEFANGGVFELQGVDAGAPQIFLYREKGASVFESTRSYLVPRGMLEERQGRWWFRNGSSDDWGNARRIDGEETLKALAAVDGVQPLPGFDTFWYNWVSVHGNTIVLD